MDAHARRLGRYWLLKPIARGGMGEVYLAATTGIEGAERPCVVKIIRREHAKDASFLARFLDEARVQAQLHHPGVVQVFEASKDDNGEPFVAVEYVEGRSLGEVRTRCLQVAYRVSWAEAVAFASSVADALAHIHERVDVRGDPLGIIHRDLSPQNIMVGYGGDIKIIDFGTARGENRRCHTVSGVVFAKPGYVAPEVANGVSGDARVDLYALGVILWELAAGRRFLQGDAAEHLAAVASGSRSVAPISQLIGAPPRLDAIIAKLTAHEPDKRYVSARTVLADLSSLLSLAPSLSNGERNVRPRIAQLMATLYPGEPIRSRQEFAKLVSVARKTEHDQPPKTASAPEPPKQEVSTKPPQPVDPSVLPGTRYRIQRKIGQGSMGAVYEAEHLDLGRHVALKILAPEHATSADYAVRFRREARALSRLSHPNLVVLHDFGQASDGRIYCAMEMLEGQTLDKTLRPDEPRDWTDALRLCMQVASALQAAHTAGIIHRDIKPANLFVCRDETVKLLDFGLLKMSGEAGELKHEGLGLTLFGTPEYMAPEQIDGRKVDARADVYGLGCVLYELLSGQPPFNARTALLLLDVKRRQDPPSLRSLPTCRSVPQNVNRLLARLLARDPECRVQSATEFLSLASEALLAPERQRQRSRSMRLSCVSAGFAIALSLGAGSLTQQYGARVHDAVKASVPSVLAAIPWQRLHTTNATSAPQPLLPSKEPSPVPEAMDPGQSALTMSRTPTSKQEPVPASETDLPISIEARTDTAKRLKDSAQRFVVLREWESAVRAARRWVEVDSTHESRLFLARLLVHTSRCNEAMGILEPEARSPEGVVRARALARLCSPASSGERRDAKTRTSGDKSRVASAGTPE